MGYVYNIVKKRAVLLCIVIVVGWIGEVIMVDLGEAFLLPWARCARLETMLTRGL